MPSQTTLPIKAPLSRAPLGAGEAGTHLEDQTGPPCFFGLAICFWYSIQPLTSSCRIIT